jgi:predicted nucleic acid-binding protein
MSERAVAWCFAFAAIPLQSKAAYHFNGYLPDSKGKERLFMPQREPTVRLPGVPYAVSNTGPLISAFQSDSFSLLTRIFAKIHVPVACIAELETHGWEREVQAVAPRLVPMKLTVNEEQRALTFARQIAQHPDTDDPVAENHQGEAQAIVLALRAEYRDNVLLLDELAARAIAKEAGLKLSGFPGALLLATRYGLISADELKARLETCRQQGTHYGATFIQQVYLMAKTGGR